ncbi:hypothetical protein ACWD4V_21655 [Streptomyces tsukubensis]
MNDGTHGRYHSAAFDSTVGIQAEAVHNSNVYFVHPDTSPEDKYRIGVQFLENGIPSRAREMIGEAIADHYDSAEVSFHLVLAMLSGRAYHDLNTEERQQLHRAFGRVPGYAEGEWKDALRVAFELLEMHSAAEDEAGRVLDRLEALSPRRRDALLHHLDLVLTGGLKESLWAGYRDQAEADRFGNNRSQRVWAYFEPEPIGPRALMPRPSTGAPARARIRVRTGVFAVATAFLSVSALVADPAAAAVELLVLLVAGPTAIHFGGRWHYQERRLRARRQKFPVLPAGHPAAAGDGFTNRVRQSFDSYFSNRVPHGVAPQEWFGLTTHIRNGLVAEIALLYRESRIGVERVNWLIRHLAEDARDRYQRGTLFDDPLQNRTSAMVKAVSVAALAALGIATLFLLDTVTSGAGALPALLAAVAAVWSGHTASASWLEARSEENRLAEETREYEERLGARQAAYQNWKSFLDATRPNELEMETWLTCDKTLFVDEALRHYQLGWRDLITHTLLMTPVRPYKRGRVKGGPWRYSRYSLRLFLVTQDGVREVSAEFEISEDKWGNGQRSNYRFDALSSVQVAENPQVGYDLELILTNGPARNIRVKDADTHQLASDEDAEQIAEINLSSAGFTHTFRLLEGLAADGKGWIERNNPRNLPSFHAAG